MQKELVLLIKIKRKKFRRLTTGSSTASQLQSTTKHNEKNPKPSKSGHSVENNAKVNQEQQEENDSTIVKEPTFRCPICPHMLYDKRDSLQHHLIKKHADVKEVISTGKVKPLAASHYQIFGQKLMKAEAAREKLLQEQFDENLKSGYYHAEKLMWVVRC